MITLPWEEERSTTLNPTTSRRCRCGTQLNWESSTYLGETQWIATCPNPGCGEIHSAHDADTTLKTYLLGGREPRPDAPPWLRLFLRASQLPNTDGWQVATGNCWFCDERDLTVRFSFRPLFIPESVVLCLTCGAVEATFYTEGTLSRSRGNDWVNLTGTVGDLRRAIRERQALADEGRDEAMEGLWDD